MAPSNVPARDLIIASLKEKGVLKQNIFQRTRTIFKQTKQVMKSTCDFLELNLKEHSDQLYFRYRDKGDFEAMLSFAGDTLVISMHTNVFCFDRSHPVWKSSYVKEDELRAYCGVIHIYNFLTDSFRYSRENDLGYLIARIFINHEGHFFVEGKRQLGFLYNNFATDVLTEDAIRQVIESAILYAINFDLLLPEYSQIKQISILDIENANESWLPITAKRFGFSFEADRADD